MSGDVALTQRQRQILDGIARGLGNAEIGGELYLSENSIKTHVRTLFRKLRVHDRAHAVAVAHQRGLLATDDVAMLVAQHVAQCRELREAIDQMIAAATILKAADIYRARRRLEQAVDPCRGWLP